MGVGEVGGVLNSFLEMIEATNLIAVVAATNMLESLTTLFRRFDDVIEYRSERAAIS